MQSSIIEEVLIIEEIRTRCLSDSMDLCAEIEIVILDGYKSLGEFNFMHELAVVYSWYQRLSL